MEKGKQMAWRRRTNARVKLQVLAQRRGTIPSHE